MPKIDKSVKQVQISIVISASMILVVRLILPSITIDSIKIILFLVAVIPWVIPLFKQVQAGVAGGSAFPRTSP